MNDKKVQFAKETDAEQAEIDQLKSDVQAAIDQMYTDQKAYQTVQDQLLKKVQDVSVAVAVAPGKGNITLVSRLDCTKLKLMN